MMICKDAIREAKCDASVFFRDMDEYIKRRIAYYYDMIDDDYPDHEIHDDLIDEIIDMMARDYDLESYAIPCYDDPTMGEIDGKAWMEHVTRMFS